MYAFFIVYKNKTSVTYNLVLLSIFFVSGTVLGVVDLWMIEINKAPIFKVLITLWGVIIKVIKTNKWEMPKYFLRARKREVMWSSDLGGSTLAWVAWNSSLWSVIWTETWMTLSEPRPEWHVDSVMLRFERMEFQVEGWARKNPLR